MVINKTIASPSTATIQRLSNAFHHSTDAIVLTNKDGIIKDINPAFTKMYGYSSDEALGKTNRILRSSVTEDNIYVEMWNSLLTKNQWKGELFNKTKDGIEIPVYVSITPIYESEELTGYMGLTIDLSEKYQLGKELVVEKRFSESLLNTVNSLVISLDTEGKIIIFNSYCESFLGYKETEVINKNWFELFSDKENRKNDEAVYNSLLQSGGPLQYENEILTKSGETRTILWSITTLKDENGNISGVLAIGQDMTEFLTLRQKIGRSEQLAVLGQLAAGIAHEVGNPLTSISSLVQVLQRQSKEGATRDKLDLIIGQTRRITQIIRDLVDFSRPSDLEEEPTDINAQIEKAVRIVLIDEKSKNVDFKIELAAKLSEPVLIADQLFQVILNLILNSLDAVKNGAGVIKLKSKEVNNSVIIEVIDDGIGVSSDKIERIFEPFFTTKEVGKGTGLGLWVSRGIINSFGGSLSVKSEEGSETTFTVSIPLRSKRKTA